MTQSVEEIYADKAWWQQIKKYFPDWDLFGFTERKTAGFFTAKADETKRRPILNINGGQFTQLLNKLEELSNGRENSNSN